MTIANAYNDVWNCNHDGDKWGGLVLPTHIMGNNSNISSNSSTMRTNNNNNGSEFCLCIIIYNHETCFEFGNLAKYYRN